MPAKKQATVELVFDDAYFNRQEVVEITASLIGERMLTAIDNAVEKKFKGEPWVRWNLLDVAHN